MALPYSYRFTINSIIDFRKLDIEQGCLECLSPYPFLLSGASTKLRLKSFISESWGSKEAPEAQWQSSLFRMDLLTSLCCYSTQGLPLVPALSLSESPWESHFSLDLKFPMSKIPSKPNTLQFQIVQHPPLMKLISNRNCFPTASVWVALYHNIGCPMRDP